MNEFLKVIPFFDQDNPIVGKITNDGLIRDPNLWRANPPVSMENQYMPVLFKKKSDSDFYLLPYEPLVSISGRNPVIKRYPAKRPKQFKGSIKERYNRDDMEITISGFLFGAIETGDVSDCFPMHDFKKLKEYLICGEPLEFLHHSSNVIDILQIVIESIDFPFTKGENVQAYEIKAYSYFTPKLLIPLEKVE